MNDNREHPVWLLNLLRGGCDANREKVYIAAFLITVNIIDEHDLQRAFGPKVTGVDICLAAHAVSNR